VQLQPEVAYLTSVSRVVSPDRISPWLSRDNYVIKPSVQAQTLK
jgi:hypothetical protein